MDKSLTRSVLPCFLERAGTDFGLPKLDGLQIPIPDYVLERRRLH